MICRNYAWMIVRAPDSRMAHVPLARGFMPPIGRTWIAATPENEIAVSPITIVIQPRAHRPADAEGDERRAIRSVIINLGWLIDRHINHLGISRNNFNVAAVGNDLLLRGGLQVA
jgi:hypothetical protein